MPTLGPEQALGAATMRRVSWRGMPFLLLAYLIAYIDRVNVGFAALQMNKAVGLDPKTYGLGAGIFFIGYFILEVPSNLALQRFGARTWIAGEARGRDSISSAARRSRTGRVRPSPRCAGARAPGCSGAGHIARSGNPPPSGRCRRPAPGGLRPPFPRSA